MTEKETWNVKRLLEWTTDYLKRHGSSSARLDAEVLLAHCCRCQRIELYVRFETEPDEPTRTRFREMIKQRAAGKPVAYLVGFREFFSLSFEVTPDVLIPRPETEQLVLTVLDFLKGRDSAAILDIGTGSGAIAVTVSKHFPEARVTAVDVSTAALAVAQRNAVQHHVQGQIEFLQSDLMSGLGTERRFDVIVSNPPYIGEIERSSLSRDVVEYEPSQALFSGSDGTEATYRIIDAAPRYLKPGGLLAIETSPIIGDRCLEKLRSNSDFSKQQLLKDSFGNKRILSGIRN